MTQINPYIGFNGKCREAMNFYKECLGGELNMMAVKDTPAAASCPAGTEDQIMHSSLTKNGMVVMATDMAQGTYQQGNNVALSVNCSSEEEINTFFNNLAAGGTITCPLGVQFWGDTFGSLTDKFGIHWMFNYSKNQNQ